MHHAFGRAPPGRTASPRMPPMAKDSAGWPEEQADRRSHGWSPLLSIGLGLGSLSAWQSARVEVKQDGDS
jgi:hypothetical protein